MLAEVLVATHVAEGYSAVAISEDISEAHLVYEPGAKQLFCYDDFLGEIGTGDQLRKNEDKRLMEFMRQVSEGANKRFILTTREYILAQAAALHERLSRLSETSSKLVIELSDYTLFERAQILYNHLYFTEIPESSLESVLKEERYKLIVRHPNYSPRILETVVRLATTGKVEGEQFFELLVQALDFPERLWDHAFRYQLTDLDQSVLLALASFPGAIELDHLRHATSSLHEGRAGSVATGQTFRESLRTLEGTFVRIGANAEERIVTLQNPSIRDFLLGYIDREGHELHALLTTCIYFEQPALLAQYAAEQTTPLAAPRLDFEWGSDSTPRFPGMAAALERDPSLLSGALTRTLDAPELPRWLSSSLPTAVRIASERFPFERRLTVLVTTVAGRDGMDEFEARLREGLAEVIERWEAGVIRRDDATELIAALKRQSAFKTWFDEQAETLRKAFAFDLSELTDYRALARMRRLLPSILDEEDESRIADEWTSWASDEADWIIDDADDEGELRRRIEELRLLGNEFGVQIEDHVDWDRYEERVTEFEEANEEDESIDAQSSPPEREDSLDEDEAIDALFQSIRPDPGPRADSARP